MLNLTPKLEFTKEKRRMLQACMGSALIFLLLGAGNMLYGSLKFSHSTQLLEQATKEVSSSNSTIQIHRSKKDFGPLRLIPEINMDTQAQHINKLQSRVEFYRFVILGGKIFLAFSGVSFVAILLLRLGGRA